MRTFWLSFCDGDRPKGQQFLGACVVDVTDEEAESSSGFCTRLKAPTGSALRREKRTPSAAIQVGKWRPSMSPTVHQNCSRAIGAGI